jgi:hypothetical protein
MKQMLRALLVISCLIGTGLIAEAVLSAFNPTVVLAGAKDP